MLPEVLSNGICSLQEGVLRYAKTCIIRYDKMGNVVGRGLCQSLIKSSKRMTYLEAQALIDGDLEEAKAQAKTDTPHTEELIESSPRNGTALTVDPSPSTQGWDDSSRSA